MNTEIVNPGGRPCAQCGSPLAEDQRYCLTCGARAPETRLAFVDILRAPARPDVLPAASATNWYAPPLFAAAAPTFGDRLRTNAGLIAGVGVLLLAMLIGVLIGSRFGQGDELAEAIAGQRPQVIQVGAPAAAAAAPAAASTSTVSSPGTAATKVKNSGAATSKAPVKATNDAVQNLDKLSGKAYQKQVDKLGKNIPTGGAAPPKDNKPAAGGGSFEEIG